ncbi:MAG: MbcA/ParS/Xre antitoxin family protein [Bauldia sp.]
MAKASRAATTVEDIAPVNLNDPADQARLSPAAGKAMLRIADFWNLSPEQAGGLLGGISVRTWYRMKSAPAEAMGQDMLTRISAVVGIYKGLRLLFSEPLSNDWVRKPNRHPIFGGRTPLTAMIEGGIPKMLEVRGYVDALRGGL